MYRCALAMILQYVLSMCCFFLLCVALFSLSLVRFGSVRSRCLSFPWRLSFFFLSLFHSASH